MTLGRREIKGVGRSQGNRDLHFCLFVSYFDLVQLLSVDFQRPQAGSSVGLNVMDLLFPWSWKYCWIAWCLVIRNSCSWQLQSLSYKLPLERPSGKGKTQRLSSRTYWFSFFIELYVIFLTTLKNNVYNKSTSLSFLWKCKLESGGKGPRIRSFDNPYLRPQLLNLGPIPQPRGFIPFAVK